MHTGRVLSGSLCSSATFGPQSHRKPGNRLPDATVLARRPIPLGGHALLALLTHAPAHPGTLSVPDDGTHAAPGLIAHWPSNYLPVRGTPAHSNGHLVPLRQGNRDQRSTCPRESLRRSACDPGASGHPTFWR